MTEEESVMPAESSGELGDPVHTILLTQKTSHSHYPRPSTALVDPMDFCRLEPAMIAGNWFWSEK